MSVVGTDAPMNRPPYAGDRERWAAVMSREKNADGWFYYSVRTTGVYCRPSCPSRRAHRHNVAFYRSCREAEDKGFRPCKRCRPNEASLDDRYGAIVTEACRSIETADVMPSLDELASVAGLSKYHFHRVFKKVAGLTPKQYAIACRDRKFREVLPGSRSVTEAIYDAGFNSSGRFYARSQDVLGMTPSSRRTGGAGERIRFAIGECALGAILVAATEKGVCSIELADSPTELLRLAEEQYKNAELIAADADFERWVAGVVAFVDSPHAELDLPLDISGTAFQRKVWKALQEIPAGETASYTDVARMIEMPAAARAVARACAANKLAVAIPCHRVVRSDGGLSGYRWGVAKKRVLLEREAEHSEQSPPRRDGENDHNRHGGDEPDPSRSV